jgi:hypothetical protein
MFLELRCGQLGCSQLVTGDVHAGGGSGEILSSGSELGDGRVGISAHSDAQLLEARQLSAFPRRIGGRIGRIDLRLSRRLLEQLLELAESPASVVSCLLCASDLRALSVDAVECVVDVAKFGCGGGKACGHGVTVQVGAGGFSGGGRVIGCCDRLGMQIGRLSGEV